MAAEGAFVKYDKIGETSGPIGTLVGSKLPDAYLVTEKVHGASFCLIASAGESDSATVHFAKRTAVLGTAEDAEDFYNCRSSGLLRQLEPLAQAVFRQLAEEASAEVSRVRVYGELFGGSYPHPAVPSEGGLDAVQVGVWYAPALHFLGFDVAVEVAGREQQYLDFAAARRVCEACGLLFAAPLHEGTLGECLDFPIEFESTIPARLGLPPLQRNVAEGVVIRPKMEPPPGHRRSVRPGKESLRGLFKRKIPEFSEKQYQTDSWKLQSRAGGASCVQTVSEEELVRLEIAAAATEQRVHNVLSKTGQVDPADKVACRQLLADMREDVIESLTDGDADLLSRSSSLQAELDQQCRSVITHVLLQRRKGGMPA